MAATGNAVSAFLDANNLIGSWDRGKSFETRRGEFHVKANAAALAFLQTNTQPGQEVFVYPYQPIFYFTNRSSTLSSI